MLQRFTGNQIAKLNVTDNQRLSETEVSAISFPANFEYHGFTISGYPLLAVLEHACLSENMHPLILVMVSCFFMLPINNFVFSFACF